MYRLDRSNQDPVFLRNWIRLNLIPQLKERIDPHLPGGDFFTYFRSTSDRNRRFALRTEAQPNESAPPRTPSPRGWTGRRPPRGDRPDLGAARPRRRLTAPGPVRPVPSPRGPRGRPSPHADGPRSTCRRTPPAIRIRVVLDVTDTGSPLLHWTKRQTELVQQCFPNVRVRFGMQVGNPPVAKVVDEMIRGGVERLIVLPMYPQYYATTFASATDVLFQALMKQRRVPALADSAWKVCQAAK